MIKELIKDLKQVAAYLDVIVFDSDPIAHIETIRSLFERLREHNLKLSPSKARLGATDANFLGHSISPAGLRPTAEKVSALINMPMPADVKQVRALMSGINYYRNFLPDLSKRLRPINSLLRKGVKFAFTPAMEKFGSRHPGGACDSADSSFPQLGCCRRRVTPVPRVLRRLHRRVWRRPRTGAGGRFHQTHRVHQPSYARLGKTLDSSRLGGR